MNKYVAFDDDYLALAELEGAGIDSDSVIVVQRDCAACGDCEGPCRGLVDRVLPVGVTAQSVRNYLRATTL